MYFSLFNYSVFCFLYSMSMIEILRSVWSEVSEKDLGDGGDEQLHTNTL